MTSQQAGERTAFADRSRVAWWFERIGPSVIVLVTVIAVVTPVVYVFRSAFLDSAAGLRDLATEPDLWSVVFTTAELAVGSGLVALVLGAVLAVCANGMPANRGWLGLIPLVPLLLPQISFVIGYIFLLSPKAGYINSGIRAALPFLNLRDGPVDIYSTPWIIITTGISMSSLVFLFVRSGLGQLHQDLLDAAATSGAGPVGVFFRVLLPLLRPSLIYSGSAVILMGLGQFTVPLLLGTKVDISVLTTKMYAATAEFPTNEALAAAYGLPILGLGLVFVVAQKLLLHDQDRFVTTGGRGARAVQSRGRLRQAVLLVYGLVAIGLPVAALVVVSFEPYWSGRIDFSGFTFDNITAVFNQQSLLESIGNSALYAVGTVVVVLPLSYLCARTIYNGSRRPVLAWLQDTIVSVPLGIPAVILGTGFLLAYTESPLKLYGTPWALILVYVTIMIPFSTRLLLASMINLGHDVLDAASVNGAGILRRTVMVELPLLRVAMGTAAALVVVLSSHEFAASILVRSPQTQVMGTQLYDLFAFGSYPQTAVMALLTCLVTGVGVAVAVTLGGRGVFGRADG